MLQFSRWSVRAQLMLLVMAVTVPALLALVLFVLHERQEARDGATDRVSLLAQHTAADLSRVLREHEELLARMAQRPLVRALDATRCDPVVAEYTQLQPGYTNLVVRDLAGSNDCSALPNKITRAQITAGLAPGYLEAKDHDGMSVGAAHVGPLSGRWVSVLYYPVRSPQGAVAGLIGLPVNLQTLSERLFASVPANDLVLVFDASGRIVMRSRDVAQWLGKAVPDALLAGASGGVERSFSAPGADGVQRLFAVASVPGTDWRVVAGVPVTRVFAAPNHALSVGVLMALACVALALAVAWRLGLNLVRPIDALSHVATQVAYGQVALRAHEQSGPVEIAAVAHAFNHMLDVREQAVQSLRDSEERFRTLTALSSDWYWEQDSEYRFVRIDGRTRRRDGLPVQAYFGKRRWDFPALNLGPADWERHRSMLQAHEEFRDFEIERLDPSGRQRWITVSGTPMHDAAGRFCGYRGVGSDITERKLLEQRRQRLSERIEELSRGLVQAQEETRRRFSSELHDRTSPNLAALRINLDMIAAATPPARLSLDYTHRIEDTRALIDDTTASIREICADLHPLTLELGGLVGAMQSYARQFARRTGLQVAVECGHGEHRLAADVELALFRIVQEAMTNCAKHAKASQVTLQVQLQSRPAWVRVLDDGQGFDSTNPSAGRGLGLQTMRETAEFVGMGLSIESAPGRGTCVCVEVAGSSGETAS